MVPGPGVLEGPARPLARPLSGDVAVEYGAPERGTRSKGWTIDAGREADVVAAGDGRVGFADDSFRGYGRTIVLEHPGGMFTVYGGCSVILTAPGARVARGQTIARARRLYFEIRKGSRAVDPARFLPAA